MKWVKKSQASDAIKDANWSYLNVFADWKFVNLRRAVAKVVGNLSRTLLMYSDDVRSNIVGDTEHPLVREVPTLTLCTYNGCPCVVPTWM